MTSSSSEFRPVATSTAIGTSELRTGEWTRLGGSSVLGDAVTEKTLSQLAEKTRLSAQAQGYAIGWAEGRRQAALEAESEAVAIGQQREAEDRRRAEEHQREVAALRAAATELRNATAHVCNTVETHATHVAITLVEAILGRELSQAGDPVGDAVRRALTLMPGEPLTRIRLNPDDARSPRLAELLEEQTVVVPDASLHRGDAVVEADDHVIDARIGTALERVREVLEP